MNRPIQRIAVAALSAFGTVSGPIHHASAELTAPRPDRRGESVLTPYRNSQDEDELPTSAAFEEAVVIEELEHDLRRALELYAAIADDEGAQEALRRRAWLRIGRARAALGQMEEARAALELAAAGDDAVAQLARERLADPGRDEERARLLREEAQRWISELPAARPDSPLGIAQLPAGRNLVWIGGAAVPVIVRELEASRASDPRSPHTETLLFGALWRIGGPEAEAYLDRVRGLEPMEFRRAAARGLEHDNALAGGTVGIAERYLRDPHPSGEVAVAALKAPSATVERYDVAEVIAQVDAPVADVRVAALQALLNNWPEIAPEPLRALEQLLPALERALAAVSPRVGQAALACLRVVGCQTGQSRALLLRALVGTEVDQTFATQPVLAIAADDAGARALRELLPALAPADLNGDLNRYAGRDRAVQALLDQYLDVFDTAQLDIVLTALRAGFLSGRLASWLSSHCGSSESERILAVVPELRGAPAYDRLVDWLVQTPLGPNDWPHLERVEEQLRRWEPGYDWSDERSRWWSLYAAMGRTGHPEAIARLAELVQQPLTLHHYRALAWALQSTLAVVGERSFEPARALLLTPRSGVEGTRQQLFAELVRAGDPSAYALLPRVAELGPAESVAYSRPRPLDPGPFRGASAEGVGWLPLHWGTKGELVWFHGYDEATVAAIWDELLARPRGEAWNRAWDSLGDALTPQWTRTTHRGAVIIPAHYLAPPPRLVEVGARRWAERAATETESANGTEQNGLVALLDIGRRRAVEDEAALAAVRALHFACLDSPAAELRWIAVDLLPDELDEQQRAALLEALGDPSSVVTRRAFARVFDQRQPVPPELFARALENPDADMRATAIRQAAPLVEGGAVALVRPTLDDPAAVVRAAACEYLGTQAEADVVPELLERLTDLSADVRTSAANALRAIRFYHDEKAHWDRVYAGIELSAAGAAEALLRQAAPEEPHEQRLLAIRSLGSLGAPETLPFLIEWTRDADAELAAEARAAIARIHAR